MAWAQLECGMKLFVPLDDYVGRAAYFVGDLDRKITRVIQRIVRPGDHVLDIGANLGIVSLPLALLVGENGSVNSFEPNPRIREYLLNSLRQNNLKNVRVHGCALGAEEGEIDLSYPSGNAGQGTLTTTRTGDGWRSVKVPVRTLSAIAKDLELDKIRLVKIDVEGYEPQVLCGARAWLANHRPDAFLFESNDKPGQDGSDCVRSLFREFGYSLYSIPKRLFELSLVPSRGDADGETACHDMIALSRESEPEIVSRFKILEPKTESNRLQR